MAEDRFANVFTASVTESAAGVLTFVEMTFGITLRDRVAIVLDELLFYVTAATLSLMTANSDQIMYAVTVSDQVTDLEDLADRRILYAGSWVRMDFGTAASAQILHLPVKAVFSPPMIALPNRLFLGVDSGGLASAIKLFMRMHFRTVKITQDQQLIEVLEAFQLST